MEEKLDLSLGLMAPFWLKAWRRWLYPLNRQYKLSLLRSGELSRQTPSLRRQDDFVELLAALLFLVLGGSTSKSKKDFWILSALSFGARDNYGANYITVNIASFCERHLATFMFVFSSFPYVKIRGAWQNMSIKLRTAWSQARIKVENP